MKNSLLFSFLFSSLSLFSNIDTTNFNSKIENVTVFFSGAEIERVGELSLNKGKHVLLIDNLPEMINPQSIQVEGLKNLTILSVKHELAFDNTLRSNPEVLTIEENIKSLSIKIKRLNNEINVLKTEEEILLNNSNLSNKDKAITTEELAKAAEFYRARLNEIRNKVIDLNLEIEENKTKMVEQFEKINKLLSKNKQRYSKVLIAVECESAVTDKLKFSYYVRSAGWIPTYDFRVKDTDKPLKIVYNANVYQTSGEDWKKVNITLSSNDPSLSGNKPELQQWVLGEQSTYLIDNQAQEASYEYDTYGGVSSLKGIITDEQGEPVPFANVTLFKNDEQILGTTSDFDGAYTLKPLEPGRYDMQVSYVGYQSKRISGISILEDKITIQNIPISEGIQLNEVEIVEYSKPLIELDQTTTGYTQTRNEMYTTSYESKTNVRGSRSGSSKRFIDGVKSKNYIDNSFNNNTLSLEYEIKIPYSIPTDGKDYTIKIKETDVPVEYEYFIVPKIDKDAFLVANLDNWEELNLLSGKSSLYFQGKFTGESYINVDQAEDTLTISLGRDKGIFVSREQSKELDDKRFYTNDIKETIGWDIVVKNNKNVEININLQDQYPVSNRKSMEVELLESMGATNDEKLGMLDWNFTLAPLEKKELSFKYEVNYPKYSNIRVR